MPETRCGAATGELGGAAHGMPGWHAGVVEPGRESAIAIAAIPIAAAASAEKAAILTPPPTRALRGASAAWGARAFGRAWNAAPQLPQNVWAGVGSWQLGHSITGPISRSAASSRRPRWISRRSQRSPSTAATAVTASVHHCFRYSSAIAVPTRAPAASGTARSGEPSGPTALRSRRGARKRSQKAPHVAPPTPAASTGIVTPSVRSRAIQRPWLPAARKPRWRKSAEFASASAASSVAAQHAPKMTPSRTSLNLRYGSRISGPARPSVSATHGRITPSQTTLCVSGLPRSSATWLESWRAAEPSRAPDDCAPDDGEREHEQRLVLVDVHVPEVEQEEQRARRRPPRRARAGRAAAGTGRRRARRRPRARSGRSACRPAAGAGRSRRRSAAATRPRAAQPRSRAGPRSRRAVRRRPCRSARVGHPGRSWGKPPAETGYAPAAMSRARTSAALACRIAAAVPRSPGGSSTTNEVVPGIRWFAQPTALPG